jgi:hypothetical protein
MSGLFARTRSAGRDGVRYARSKHMGDTRGASVTFGSSRVSTDRSFHLLRPASSWAIRRATSLAGRFQIKSAWRPPAGCTCRPISSSAKRCGHGLMRVAAKAFDFEIAIARVDRVAERGRWLRRSLKAEHALVPSIAGEMVACAPQRPLCRRPNGCAVDGLACLCAYAREDRRATMDRQAATDCGG